MPTSYYSIHFIQITVIFMVFLSCMYEPRMSARIHLAYILRACHFLLGVALGSNVHSACYICTSTYPQHMMLGVAHGSGITPAPYEKAQASI